MIQAVRIAHPFSVVSAHAAIFAVLGLNFGQLALPVCANFYLFLNYMIGCFQNPSSWLFL
jgi:hypothetical protein